MNHVLAAQRTLKPIMASYDAVANANWWLSCGIPAADFVGVYAPKGAVNQAASYINLNSPGTSDTDVIVAPTWDVVNGWTFDGATQQLSISFSNTSDYISTLVRFSNVAGLGRIIDRGSGGGAYHIYPDYLGQIYFRGYDAGGASCTAPASGVLGLTAGKGYIDGYQAVTPYSYSFFPLTDLLISGSANAVSIQALVCARGIRSDVEFLALSTAMAAL